MKSNVDEERARRKSILIRAAHLSNPALSTSKNKRNQKLATLKVQKKDFDVYKELKVQYSHLIHPSHQEELGTSVLVDRLLTTIKEGDAQLSVLRLSSSRIGSRILQALLKHGNQQQRKAMVDQLTPHLLDLLMAKYGRLVAWKLFLHGVKRHQEGARSVDPKVFGQLCRKLTPKVLNKLVFHKYAGPTLSQIFGLKCFRTREVHALVNSVLMTPIVSHYLSEHKDKNVMDLISLEKEGKPLIDESQLGEWESHLEECVMKFSDKELMHLEVPHRALNLYIRTLRQREKPLNSALFAVSAEGLPYLFSTKPGVEALCWLLGYCTAKDRKTLAMSLKTLVTSLATNAVSYLGVLRLCEVTDDTQMITKSILHEITQNLPAFLESHPGKKTLYYLMHGCQKKGFTSYERQFLEAPSPTSKKDPQVRQAELRQYVEPHLQKLPESEAKTYVFRGLQLE